MLERLGRWAKTTHACLKSGDGTARPEYQAVGLDHVRPRMTATASRQFDPAAAARHKSDGSTAELRARNRPTTCANASRSSRL